VTVPASTRPDVPPSAAVSAAPVLSVRGLTVRLPGGGDREHAVEGIDFDLAAGEILCIVGESGSGKSITAQAIMGLLPKKLEPVSGEILFEGRDLLPLSDREMQAFRGARIGMIFQEPMTALNPVLTVGDQIAEMILAHRRLPAAEVRARVVAALAAVRLPEPETLRRAHPHRLSGGQRQRVMIAMAMVHDPAILIADEPTTALDVTTQAEVLRLIRQLRDDRKTSVILVTHDFGVVAEMADRVVVMRHGKVVETGPTAEVLGRPRHPYTRALIDAVPRFTTGAAAPSDTAEKLFDMRSITRRFVRDAGLFRKGTAVVAVNDVSLSLRRGETLGIVGESGSGKSTLARCAIRISDVDEGSILLEGQDVTRLRGRRLMPFRRKVQMVFQDPYASLNPRQKIGKILTDPLRVQGHARGPARERAIELLRLVGLEPQAMQRYPHEFSGGQRQRIGIARALVVDPEILIADEPVSSLDVSVQRQVLDLLADVRRRLQLSMIFITHDLRVAAQVCDRIAVMQTGKVVEQGPTAEVFGNPAHPYTRDLIAAIPGVEFFSETVD